LCGTVHVALASRRGCVAMLKRDGRWRKPLSRIRLWTMVARFLVHATPVMLRSLLPGHHPSKVRDPARVVHWTSAYAGLDEGDIPLLDTRDPESPARFA
ncbi:MAG: hypothetical protein ACK4IC_11955, partial [Erythrobacter sp.]